MCSHLAKFLWGPLGFEEMGWRGWVNGPKVYTGKDSGRHFCSS